MQQRSGSGPDLGTALESRPATESRLAFYEDSFVFDTVSGLFYRLNPTAAFVLRAIVDGTKPSEVPELLQRRYGIDRKAAVRDAELFLNEIAELELHTGREP